MFQTFVEQPVFNLLELIYAILPGHDLGIAIIIFTILVRVAMWPLVKRQLHQARAMRKLQPELKKIKKAAGSDRQKLARLQMELYKEHGIKPFATIGTLIVQIPIFIALYQSINKLINDPNTLQTFSYEWVRNLDWVQTLAEDSAQFQHSLLGLVDLSRSAISDGLYIPAIILALVASIVQYYQSKMMLPDDKDAKKLSDILKGAADGQQADQSDVSAAVSRSMIYFLPLFTFVFGLIVPAALTLYLLTSAAVGYLQQAYVLNQDQEELQEISEEPDAKQIDEKPAKKTKKKKSKKSSNRKKRKRG